MDRLHHQCGEPSCGVRHRHAKAPASNSASLRQIQPAANYATRFVYLATRGGDALSVAMASGALLQEERPTFDVRLGRQPAPALPNSKLLPAPPVRRAFVRHPASICGDDHEQFAICVSVIPLWTACGVRLSARLRARPPRSGGLR